MAAVGEQRKARTGCGGGGPEESQEPGGRGGWSGGGKPGTWWRLAPGAGSSEAVSTGHVDGIGPGGAASGKAPL